MTCLAAQGHTDTVRALVRDCGALVDTKDSQGRTALCDAARNGHPETVEALLLELHADPEPLNQLGETPEEVRKYTRSADS